MGFWHIALVVNVLASPPPPKPVKFDFRDLGARNIAYFVSDSLFEKVIGVSSAVSGWAELDSRRMMESLRGEVQIDTRSFQTGLEARNERLREKLLSPVALASYKIERASHLSRKTLEGKEPISARIEGVLTFRGKSHPQTALAKFTYLPESDSTRLRISGNLLRVSVSLDIDVQDFDLTLSATEQLFYNRYIQISVDLLGTDNPPA